MKNAIRFFTLCLFVSAVAAQTTIFLEVNRTFKEQESWVAKGTFYRFYDLPEVREIRADLLEKADVERVTLRITRKVDDADYVLMMDSKGWALESLNTGRVVGEKKKAILWENTIKDIILALKVLL